MTRAGVYAIAAVAAIAFSASLFLLTRGGMRPGDAVLTALPPSVLFGFIGFASRFVCRALPLRSTGLLRFAFAHLGSAATASGAWLLAWQNALPANRLDASLVLTSGVLLYGVMITMQYLALEVESARQAEKDAIRYQLLAREAELKAFKAQIDPHFLFNSLNAIAALCGSDPLKAREMTQLLADFFRQTLRAGALERITLAQEIELAARYLAIEKVRFGDRLVIRFDVDDEARQREVPPLLLQPLIENAVRHGIAHSIDGGTVAVSANVRDGALTIRIENPADPDRPHVRGEAIGLQNVRGRLAAISGGEASFITSEENGIFRVVIEVPA